MKKENRKSYPSDLTDKQWKEIEALYTGMKKCKWSRRELTNAVLYLVDTGCKWRQLPHDFPLNAGRKESPNFRKNQASSMVKTSQSLGC